MQRFPKIPSRVVIFMHYSIAALPGPPMALSISMCYRDIISVQTCRRDIDCYTETGDMSLSILHFVRRRGVIRCKGDHPVPPCMLGLIQCGIGVLHQGLNAEPVS